MIRGLYPDIGVIGPLDKTVVTGRSRGDLGLPSSLRPPIYDTPADAPWKVRVRAWHLKMRNLDRKQWHPFFLMMQMTEPGEPGGWWKPVA